MAFDPAMGRLVMFGGSGPAGALNDIWLSDGKGWTPLHAPTVPVANNAPKNLADDLAWIRAASGRGEHPDPRLPLIG